MRNEIQLTDSQIEAILDDKAYLDECVLTRETLDDFRTAANAWRECGAISEDRKDGIPRIKFRDVQVGRGARRTNLLVADFGTVRVCVLF